LGAQGRYKKPTGQKITIAFHESLDIALFPVPPNLVQKYFPNIYRLFTPFQSELTSHATFAVPVKNPLRNDQ
jgi:hypothetical protein